MSPTSLYACTHTASTTTAATPIEGLAHITRHVVQRTLKLEPSMVESRANR